VHFRATAGEIVRILSGNPQPSIKTSGSQCL
jgi:hypothetical protein